MVSVFNGRFSIRQEPNKNKCVAAVHDVGDCRTVGFHQCPNSPKVFVMVDGVRRGFCNIHSPAGEAKRKVKADARQRAWQERHEAKWAVIENFRKFNDASRKTLEKIASGHNDPRTLAIDTLKKFPKENKS
jgi:hypothetical protein